GQQRYPRPPPQGTPHSATPASTPSPHPAHSHGSATQESRRPRDQARPSDSTLRDARPNKARPMMLCPEARRSPNVGTAGATPTPSTDSHATARADAASLSRCRNRRRLSSEKRDNLHVVITTGRASSGTRPRASGSTSTASPRKSSGGSAASSAISASSRAASSR